MTAKLIYVATRSLDGYIEDAQGKIDWTSPGEEGHLFVNDLLRPVCTYLYGRRMYETMQVWKEFGTSASDPPSARDFAAVWKAAEKIVYSKTLKHVSTPNTRLEQTFDVDAIREMKSRATRDIGIGGHELAAHAFQAGLVDELYLFIAPVLIGGGKTSFPEGVRVGLELVNERRFPENGVVHLHYRVRTA